MNKKRIKLLDYIDSWIKKLQRHFKYNRNQGRIFFFNVTFAFCLWAIIIAFYIGQSISEILLNIYQCK